MKKHDFCPAVLLFVVFLFRTIGIAFAESGVPAPDGVTEAFLTFSSNVSGRYMTVGTEDIIVVEMIPAFGRLFVSVGRYLSGNSLYSYYAAEILPLCPEEPENCPYDHSADSFEVEVRLFSNMSIGGSYWPGRTVQHLTIIPGGLMISNYSGSGDALISKEDTLLSRSDKAPSMFPYGPEKAEKMFGCGLSGSVPEFLTGSRKSSLLTEDGKPVVEFTIRADGTMDLLRERAGNEPPLFLWGGFSVVRADAGSADLCYLLSSPSSGTMPYMGCVVLNDNGEHLTAVPSLIREDDVILADGAEGLEFIRR